MFLVNIETEMYQRG